MKPAVRTMPRLLVLVNVVALAGCASAPAASPPPSPPSPPVAASTPSEPPPSATAADTSATAADVGMPPPRPIASAREQHDTSGSPRERLMRSHFREAALIRTAVINGKLADAVAPAEALATTEGLGKIEPAWQSSIDVLQYAAKRIQHGSDVPAAAAAVADIGIACGACHAAAGGPHPKIGSPPALDGSLPNRMGRHVWATERLWEGIYAPADASWKAGVDALSREPFPKDVLDKGDVHARSAAARFKSLVATAGSKRTPQERAQLYASLLETCAACHVVTRK